MSTAEGSDSASVSSPEAQRVRDVFDLHEFGVELFRQRMRREHPAADEAEIAALTRAWLSGPQPHSRPQAEARTSRW